MVAKRRNRIGCNLNWLDWLQRIGCNSNHLNWLQRAGIDPFAFLRRYRERIVYMHVRDQKGERWTEALGEGDFDLDTFRMALGEINFRGDLAIELAHERDHKFVRSMGENFKLSYRNLEMALTKNNGAHFPG